MASEIVPQTDADREIDAGLAALERLLHGPLVNTPVTHGLAVLALEMERLRARVAALEAKAGGDGER